MSDLPDTPSIFHITHHKAGSQWVYTVLQNLFPLRVVHPQKDSGHFTQCPVLPGRIYPTVYIGKADFDRIPMPGPWRAFAVIRDLRDTLVSAYFHYSQHRKDLMEAGKEEGFRILMETFLGRELDLQLSWLRAGVPVFRYEDMMADAAGVWRQILDATGLRVSEAMLQAALRHASFEARSGRKPGEEDAKSHYRKGTPGDWKNHLHGELLALFKSKFGQGLIDTGYETGLDWGTGTAPEADSAPATPAARPASSEDEERIYTLSSTELRDRVNKRLAADRATLTRQLDLERLQRPEWLLQRDFLEIGDGWYLPDAKAEPKLVWMADLAGLRILRPSGARLALHLDLEPGPAWPGKEMILRVSTGEDASSVGEFPVNGRQNLTISLPPSIPGSPLAIQLQANSPAGSPKVFEGDPRVMAAKVYGFGVTVAPA